uniref:Ovule protein n=1 Tax=Meloidogyne incognita TaxID=6306 RepID=A0A914NMH8_MELIC
KIFYSPTFSFFKFLVRIVMHTLSHTQLRRLERCLGLLWASVLFLGVGVFVVCHFVWTLFWMWNIFVQLAKNI